MAEVVGGEARRHARAAAATGCVTRSYRSISLTAARTTSTSGTGSACCWPCSAPGEDEQVLAVPAHDGGQVVELEEGGEPVRVLLALLQALDDGELALDEAEGAQREVDEGAVDRCPAAAPAGRRRRRVRRAVPRGRRPSAGAGRPGACGRPPGWRSRSCSGERRAAVQGVDGPDDLGELVVAAGERDRFLGSRVRRPRRAARRPRRTDERPGEGAGHGVATPTATSRQAAEERRCRSSSAVTSSSRSCSRSLGPAVVEGGLDAAHQVDAGGERRVHASAPVSSSRSGRARAGR